MITETQSAGFDIWEAFYNIVSADSYFSGYTIRPTRMLPVQANLIPYLGIYLSTEDMRPDGDANAGMVRFTHSGRVCFSIVNANSNPLTVFKSVDAAFLRIMTLLWTDQHLMNTFVNNNPEAVGIESIARGERRWVWGSTGVNNETPFCELQYDVNAFWRSEWYPDITDTLNEIDVTTGIKPGDTQAEMDQRLQVQAHYIFPTPQKGKPNGHDANAAPPARSYGPTPRAQTRPPRRTPR